MTENGKFERVSPDESPRSVHRSHSGTTSMNVKHLILLFATVVVTHAGRTSEAPTAWDNSPVGECVRNYTAPNPTADYPVTVQHLRHVDARKNRYLWVWDPTPAKNPTRQLVRIGPDKIGCTILFMPFSEFHDFKLTSSGELPEKVTSTSPTANDEKGAYFIERVYLFDTRTGMYGKTPSCYRVRVGQAGKEKVDCDLD
jgi:hypothetical protein